jgi:hypothetical protein
MLSPSTTEFDPGHPISRLFFVACRRPILVGNDIAHFSTWGQLALIDRIAAAIALADRRTFNPYRHVTRDGVKN